MVPDKPESWLPIVTPKLDPRSFAKLSDKPRVFGRLAHPSPQRFRLQLSRVVVAMKPRKSGSSYASFNWRAEQAAPGKAAVGTKRRAPSVFELLAASGKDHEGATQE